MRPGVQDSNHRFAIVVAGLTLIYISTILIIIGLTTNNWYAIWDNNWHNRKIEIEFGLHRVCFKEGEKCSNPGSNYDQTNNIPKVQALVIVGGFMSLFSTIFSMINVASDRLGWSNIGIVGASSIFALIGGLFEMIGLILYSTKVEIQTEYVTFYNDIRLGWSFGLVCLAVAFLFIGGSLNAVSSMSKPVNKFLVN